ncbi:DUF3290 family protein [Lactococcus hircilactis]|uniref:DUF3290 family protein n=1 Tax=Lactococcus hircilactis TaxID=1494462 RepID=A0A7X2D162_9LACT|nr:Ltp family lipoprotein [Lactococcus hircilactis]MQW40176.1 DUF3290 family protein [Lactococcus hircilactis]
MSAFIGIIGFLAFLIGIIMLLINLFRKKSKKKSLILIVAGFILFVVGVSIPSNNQNKEAKDNTSTSVSSSSSSSSKKEASTPKPSKSKAPKVLTSQEKAVDGLTGNSLAQTRSAISYLYSGHMSKQELYDQLTSEYGSKMTADEANGAINRIDPLVNWNNLAVLSAKGYRESGNLTGQELLDQLTSEYGSKFPQDQAQYGVAHIDDNIKSTDIWK